MYLQLPKCERRGRICAVEVRRKRLSNMGSVEIWEFIRPVVKAGSSGSSAAYSMLYLKLYLFQFQQDRVILLKLFR
jgi:hypothetical protein